MKLNYKRTIFVGFAFFLITAFWQAYDAVVPLILTNKFGMLQGQSGFIMSLDNIFAVFLLPIFGSLSDRLSSEKGRRTPFIVIGTIFAATFFCLLGIADSLTVFMIFLLCALVSMATFRSPAVALMPDVTLKPLRSKGNAVINLMGTAGGILVLVLGMVFKTSTKGKSEFLDYIIAVIILMLASLAAFLFTVKEKKWASEMNVQAKALGIEEKSEKIAKNAPKHKLTRGQFISLCLILASVALWYVGYNAVTSKYSVYATEYLDVEYNLTLMIAQGAAIVSYIPVGLISSRIGRKKSILAGVAILATAFALASFVQRGTSEVIMYTLFSLAGIGWATINVNSFPMVVELASTSDVGKYTGFYYTASMFAQIVTPILSGVLVDALGWQVLFPYAAVFAGLSFVTMLFVKHGDSKPKRQDSLESLAGAQD